MSAKPCSNCINVILAASFVLFFQPLLAQYDWAPLDQALKTKQKPLGTSLVFAIWKRGDTLVYKKELGEFNSKSTAAIGSASRWLTAALVMQFIDEGKLSLDDKVNRWLPEFERYGKNYVTIRWCLANMTGIDDESKFLKNLFSRSKFSSLEDEVNSYAARKIRANPSQDFWYGDVGTKIAGRVLEVISKKRFDVLIKQKLFNPMTMRRTSFTSLDGGALNPAGGAQSTPDDYMKFLVMLMNKGSYGGKQILSEASVNQLLEIQTRPEIIKYAPKEATGFAYTLGSWAVTSQDGKATVLACPGAMGTWPMIDFCRGYAYLVMVKEFQDSEKSDLFLELKSLVDEQLTGSCP